MSMKLTNTPIEALLAWLDVKEGDDRVCLFRMIVEQLIEESQDK